jgi:hypothetical protein
MPLPPGSPGPFCGAIPLHCHSFIRLCRHSPRLHAARSRATRLHSPVPADQSQHQEQEDYLSADSSPEACILRKARGATAACATALCAAGAFHYRCQALPVTQCAAVNGRKFVLSNGTFDNNDPWLLKQQGWNMLLWIPWIFYHWASACKLALFCLSVFHWFGLLNLKFSSICHNRGRFPYFFICKFYIKFLSHV